MRAAFMFGAGDVRVETVQDPTITEATDAIVKVTAGCICGSDLWPYGSKPATDEGAAKGHEIDRTVDLDGVPAGYRAMADREALKVLVKP